MKTKAGALKRLSKSMMVASLAVMCIPALSAPTSADSIQSLPETTCKEVLANWGLIEIDEEDGSITKIAALDSMSQSGSINVATINQLYCIGAGAYAVDENNDLTQDGINCTDGNALLAELMHMKYTQVQDLDFNDLTVDDATKWRPIGNNGCQFMGEYDGNSKVINNLYFNAPDLTDRPYEGIGLFGSTGDNGIKPTGSPRTTAVIKNLVLRNATFIGSDVTGGIVGIADDSTQLSNISVAGVIGVRRQGGWTGGLIGWANGTVQKPITVSNSQTDVHVVIRDTTGDGTSWCTGGLVGYASATDIDESSSTVIMQDRNLHGAGGLVGCHYGGSITSSFAKGSLAGVDGIGGLIGDASVLRADDELQETLTIIDSFADVATFGRDAIGGLTGWGDAIDIENAYALGEVISTTETREKAKGIIGDDWGGTSSTAVNTFWNAETTGIAIPEDPETALGTGKTTADLRDISTFSGAGWDIGTGASSANTWRMIAGKNSNYPTLASQTPAPTCINVLEDWGMLSVDENATPTIVIDIDPAATYNVATINQLYCIGQGGFTLGGTPLINRTNIQCADERSKLSELMYATYIQTADLDFNQLTVDGATNWRPIGNNGCQFFGLYDGNDFDISNVRYHRPHVATEGETPHEGVGLFGSTGINDAALEGYTDRWATIKDVNLVDASIIGWNDVGGFVGIADGKTELLNVSFTGTVGGSLSGYGDLGGIVGWANGSNDKPVVIRNSSVDVEIVVVDAFNHQWNDGVIWCSGGIVGWANNVQVYGSVATTLANSNLHHSVGGIGGCLYGSLVEDSQATADLTSFETLGGIIAWAGDWDPDGGGEIEPIHTTIERSSSNVSLTSGHKVGGLVGGSSHLIVRDSYTTGTVSGDERVGGLVGYAENIDVQSSYASVAVTAISNSTSGGFIGAQPQGTATVSNSFWNTTVSGYSTTAGDHGTGKTTAELKTLSTFIGAGWDIVNAFDASNVWGMCPEVNDGYPFLQVLTPAGATCTQVAPSDTSGDAPTNSNAPSSTPAPTIKEQIQNRKLMESTTPAAFSQITPEQLAALPISSIRGITKKHAAVMTLAQLRALTPAQIRVLRPSTLAAIPAEWLSKLSAEQVKFLLPRQIRALSQQQIQKFSAKQRSVIASVLRKATKQSK